MPQTKTKPKNLSRCPWVPLNDILYQKYHDREWGVPVRDDKKMFEFLLLESAQAGLSWRTILHKRANYKKAFAGFDYKRIAKFDSKKVKELLNNSGIIRNRLKIEATINNARCFIKVQKEFGSFCDYIWQFTNNKTIYHKITNIKQYPTKIPEAETLAKDLKNRGFKFLGPVTCYAHMQAVGMVNDHSVNCFCFNLKKGKM